MNRAISHQRLNLFYKQSLQKFILIFLLSLLSSGHSYAASIEFELSGVGSSVNGFGRDGLYLGPDFSSRNFNTSRYNMTFGDTALSIDDVTGIGTIHGEMTRQSDNSNWMIDILLTDLVIRSGVGNATTRHDYDARTDDLAAILSSSVEGNGIEWRNLEMVPTSPAPFWGNPISTTSIWTGLSMPNIGHINVAEFYQHQDYLGSGINGLIFDAWYQRADCHYCNYQVGDTKAIAQAMSLSGPAALTAIPLPGTLFLLALGFFCIPNSLGRISLRHPIA